MIHRIAHRTTIKPLSSKSGVIAGQRYTHGCIWIKDILPS
jgi:hypothetical protein